MAEQTLDVDEAIADIEQYERVCNSEMHCYSQIQTKIQDLLYNNSQQGNFIDNAKEMYELRNFQVMLILQAYEIELDDIETYKNILSEYSGKNFDSAKLEEALEKAENLKDEYQAKLEEAEQELSDASFIDRLFFMDYIREKISDYKRLIKEEEEIIKEIKKDIESLKVITEKTKCLFKDAGPFVETALEIDTYLKDSYKNGSFDLSGAGELMAKVSRCYADMATVQENGSTSINKKQVERILAKEATDITNLEYYTLSVAFEKATDAEMEYFITLLCDKSEDKHFTQQERCSDYTVFTINADKINGITSAMNISSQAYLETQKFARIYGLEEINDEAAAIRGNVIQRSLILKTLEEISVFNGNLGGSPYIDVVTDEVGSIKVNYHVMGIEGNSYDAHGNPAMKSSISVSATYDQSTIMNRAISEAKQSMLEYYAGKSTSDSVANNMQNGTRDIIDSKMQEYVQKAVQEKLSTSIASSSAEKMVNAIPVVGVIITTIVDTAMDIEQTKNSEIFINKEFSKIENASIWDDFGCVENRVEYDLRFGSKYVYYPSEGRDTQCRVELYNQMLASMNEDSITVDDVLNNSNSIFAVNNAHLNDRKFIDNYGDIKNYNIDQKECK